MYKWIEESSEERHVDQLGDCSNSDALKAQTAITNHRKEETWERKKDVTTNSYRKKGVMLEGGSANQHSRGCIKNRKDRNKVVFL